ncbi:MAG: alpha/beta hydrolase [Bacteroidota bacterium]
MTLVYLFLFVSLIIVASYYWFINSAPPLPADVDEVIRQIQTETLPELLEGRLGTTQNGNISIGYEVIENQVDAVETVVLINGHSQIMLDWPKYFYQPLVDAGYSVIRFDNRGVGSSDWLPDYDKKKPYLLEDMAKDVIAILDKENISKAHIIGMSMGGMIGQRLAISHADRVLSLTSIMSTGYFYDPTLTNLPRDFYKNLIAVSLKYPLSTKDVATQMKLNLAIRQLQDGQGDYTLDHTLVLQRCLYEMTKRKGYNKKVVDQHSLAIEKSGSRYEELGNIMVPTLVIHGTTDPLIKFEHAEKYSAMIPEAKTLFIDGMGHDLPPKHVPSMMKAITANFERADREILDTAKSRYL